MKKILLFMLPALFFIVSVTDVKGEDFRRKYRNFSFSGMKLMSPDGGGSLDANFGAAFTSGRTYFLHSRPILGLMKIGLDATWVDLNYSNYTLTAGDVKTPWHQLEYSLHVGPSVAINPIGKLNINAYFRYAPTFSLQYIGGEDISLRGNYATMFVTGGMVSWGVIGIGAEYRFGDCNYRNFVGEGAGALDMTGFRTFITLRFK